MRRFYSPPESISATVRLSKEETHHMRDVLRLTTGAEVSVFDGTGREFACSVGSIGKDGSDLTVLAEVPPAAPESPLAIELAATVLNGERYDLIVQKAVELGVTRLTPMHTTRCEVKLKDAAKRVERWRRIAMEATKQCGRARLMQIDQPEEFLTIMNRSDKAGLMMFSERNGSKITSYETRSGITALIGPKGGWDDGELAAAQNAGVAIVTFGGRILRAETAAISITSILQHRFGDLN